MFNLIYCKLHIYIHTLHIYDIKHIITVKAEENLEKRPKKKN